MKSDDNPRRLHTPPHKEEDGECVIPGAMPAEALGDFVLATKGSEVDRIRSYVEWQASDEAVLHLEKVASEYVYGHRLDAWDVKTDKDRWWVITNPTNLYSQRLFPSLDYTISFHVGVTTRMAQSDMTEEQQDAHEHVNELWNAVAGARSTLFSAETTSEIQSVGVRCREALLLLIRRLGDAAIVPEGQEAPQAGNFLAWSDIIANSLAPGGSNERLRAYLKTVARSTWQLANWLTHAHQAKSHDGAITVEATENVISSYMTTRIKAQGQRLTDWQNDDKEHNDEST